MSAITALVRRYPVGAYFALTFAISWGGAILAIGSGGMEGSAPTADPRFAFAVVAMLAGPSVSACLLTAFLEGRDGIRALWSRVLAWRVGARWHAVALLTAPLLWVTTLLALSLTASNFVPAVVTSTDTAGLVLVGLAVALGAGVFEELGWTGFAIPRLRRRHGVFGTGVIVGVLWGAWHLLTNVFWASRLAAGELPLSTFLALSVLGVLVGYLLAFRVLMVWVYERTGSVMVAMLMHVSLTASVLILDPAGLSGAALLSYSFALAAAVWAVVALIAARSGWHLDHQPRRESRQAA